MDSTKIKSVVSNEIEKNKDKLIKVAKEILENPEPGFKEFKTAKIVSREFDALDMPYESGVDLIGETRVRLSIKYFLIALMFIIFDIEIVFLFPWAVVFRDFLQYGTFIFIEMVVFLAILTFGFVYVWRNGALDWE